MAKLIPNSDWKPTPMPASARRQPSAFNAPILEYFEKMSIGPEHAVSRKLNLEKGDDMEKVQNGLRNAISRKATQIGVGASVAFSEESETGFRLHIEKRQRGPERKKKVTPTSDSASGANPAGGDAGAPATA